MSWSRSWLNDPRQFVLLAGLVVFIVGVAGSDYGQPTCSVIDPCLPSEFGSTSLGLLVGSVIAAYLHLRTAAWIALGVPVTFVVADVLDPTMPWWAYLAVLGYVPLCWYLRGVDRQPARAAVRLGPTTDQRATPRPARVPVLGRHWLGLAAVVAVGAAALALWGLAEQDGKDAQQRAATVVTGVVLEHRDEFTVRVRLADGRQVDVDVLDVAYYPVGGEVTLYVDGRGLSQPVSEPYDATGWLALAAVAGSAAIALAWRTVDHNTALRRLLTQTQPVHAMRAIEDWCEVHVFLPGTTPGSAMVVTVPVIFADPPGDASLEADEEDAELAVEPAPALLYGDARPGHWCAVEAAGRIRQRPADPPTAPTDRLDPRAGGGGRTGGDSRAGDRRIAGPAVVPGRVRRRRAPDGGRAALRLAQARAAVPVLERWRPGRGDAVAGHPAHLVGRDLGGRDRGRGDGDRRRRGGGCHRNGPPAHAAPAARARRTHRRAVGARPAVRA